jgi:Holliday junction resolvasome RuvABC endonuclease subunit
MLFLGVDQSLRSSGVAVISEEQESVYLGRIAPAKLSDAPRLAAIRDALQTLITTTPDIRFAALEGYAYDVGAGRVFELGEVGAVVKLALYDAKIPFIVVPPASLKQFVADHGNANKTQMRISVLRRWGYDITQDDECDAFGLAQVARAVHLNKGTTRSELEVLKKLRTTDKKVSLVSFKTRFPSI